VATVLGLLLVVTFIATYLSTTLPNQMSVNDLDHDTLVQNQVAQLAGTADAIASAGILGGQASFPISLGSASTPPFAGPDSAQIGPLTSHNYTHNLGLYAMFANYSMTSSSGTQALSAGANPGAGFLVSLRNTYSAAGEVAFDNGAVIYAEPGGVPVMEDPPAITLSGSALSIVVPVFVHALGSEAGTSTALVGLRLTSVQSVTLPVTGFSLATGSSVVIHVFTPFAAAWLNYFDTASSFAAATVSCSPTVTSAATVCSPSYVYEPNGINGEVTISIPATSLTITQAYFAISLS
jgi:hypothetical protein